MDYQQLLTDLLQCQFGEERRLLKENKTLANVGFVNILTREAAKAKSTDRESWAKIQYLLGLVIYYHLEDSEVNTKFAIAFLNNSLTVFSEADFPAEWATVQNYLGNIVRHLNGGKSKKHIESAIAHYKNALRIRQSDSDLQLWCSTQYNLGVTYGILANLVETKQQVGCLELAKNCWENCLRFTKPNKEQKWAETKIAVGALSQESSLGDKVENLYYAINCYQEALTAAEAREEIQVIASAWEYLGHGYRGLSRHENTKDNLERAYSAYQNALERYDRETQSYNWAATQNDLGIVAIASNKTEEAISRFEQALTIITPTAFPDECDRIARNLGNLAYENKLWQKAIAGYELAIAAVEVSRNRTNSDEQRQSIIQEALGIYSRMIEACIALGTEADLAKALETVERSRSRYLTDLIASHELYGQTDLSPKIEKLLKEYDEVQQRIDNLRSQYEKKIDPEDDSIRNPWRSIVNLTQKHSKIPPEVFRQLEEWEAEKQETWQQLRNSDPLLAGQKEAELIKYDRLQRLIDSPPTAILSFYSAFNHTYIFVLRQSGISYHLCDNLSLNELNTWLTKHWFEPYQDEEDSDKKRWVASMETTLQQLANKLDLDRLVSDSLENLTELIIVPHQLLHLIPFAALPLANGSYFGDRFTLRITPSCQILEFCQEREPSNPPHTYGTVVHSQSGLPHSQTEEELIAFLYGIPTHRRLQEAQANKDNYHRLLHEEKVRGVLSSHHAKFNIEDPLKSELSLANSKLELRELLTLKWRSKDLNEVFLSCCETGFGIPESTDDLLTLAAGFLCSGARSVISSLWVVEDSSTALLSFFYHQGRKQGLSCPHALQQAQLRLRNLSDRDLEKARKNRNSANEKRKQAENTPCYQKRKDEYLFQFGIWNLTRKVLATRRSQPLSHPFYWAAFTCQGLA